jgi:ribosomal protein L7/L12
MEITYTIKKTHNITDAEATLIKDLFRENRQIFAIKFIRNQYPELGLYEAKELCFAVDNSF